MKVPTICKLYDAMSSSDVVNTLNAKPVSIIFYEIKFGSGFPSSSVTRYTLEIVLELGDNMKFSTSKVIVGLSNLKIRSATLGVVTW